MWAKLFPSKPKTPDDIVKALRESILQSSSAATDDASTPSKKHNDDLSKSMHALKLLLFADPSNDVGVKDSEVLDVIRLACDTDLLILIAANLSIMEFETRKDAVQIFNNLLRHSSNTKPPPPAANNTNVITSTNNNANDNSNTSVSSPNSSTSTAITSPTTPAVSLDDAPDQNTTTSSLELTAPSPAANDKTPKGTEKKQ